MWETGTSYPQPVSAPGASCLQAVTLRGLVTADTGGRPAKGDVLVIEKPRPAANVVARRGESEWDSAPVLIVPYEYDDEDGQPSSGGEFVVKKVDGLWRVVGGGGGWMD
jgi:hypothetical protein